MKSQRLCTSVIYNNADHLRLKKVVPQIVVYNTSDMMGELTFVGDDRFEDRGRRSESKLFKVMSTESTIATNKNKSYILHRLRIMKRAQG